MLDAYIKLPELKAVMVVDEENDPFFAIWKDADGKIITKKKLPDDLGLEKNIKA